MIVDRGQASGVELAEALVGLVRTREFTVEGPLLTDVGGSLDRHVLSTPGMIGIMERNAADLALEHLAEGLATVGFEIHVRHVAAAFPGQSCLAEARVTEVIDGCKVRFAVGVTCDGRAIGIGNHERRVIAVGGPQP